MNSLILILLCAQAGSQERAQSRLLPNTTKPLSAPAALRGRTAFSVSEYTLKSSGVSTRVFRYTWKEDPSALKARLRRELPAKSGWKVDASSTWSIEIPVCSR